MRQVSLIIILSRLICHHRLREIRCELLLDWQSWLPRVPCSCNAHLCTIFKLPSWHCKPINPPHCRRLLLSHTRMHVAATHPHRCVHVQGWCDSPLPPLCPCTVVGPTDQHAPLVWISIPGARSPPQHVFTCARITSCHVLSSFNATLDKCCSCAPTAHTCLS